LRTLQSLCRVAKVSGPNLQKVGELWDKINSTSLGVVPKSYEVKFI
jgi:hypothetical protein